MVVFFVALGILIFTVVAGLTVLSVAMVAVMITTFVAGALWVSVPDTDLREFHDALSHREVLLLVAVPGQRVAEIGEMVHRRHPEAVPGGSSWTVDALGL